ncbi:hypothetical protein MCUN1_001068 [Malassezia cuniculi]|uniref:CBS domain-containing protein n=1 Tax=Malassezia cuniculi TaxID=948313 RepID=A0AAF0JAE7_9BASI|nr:hypothetical protein MCUN1_001068 [Malassezia cuniculi]
MSSSYRSSPAGSDTRKRQSRRDEASAIRKRIEGELSRKVGRPATPVQRRRRQAQAGTVSALRPLPALTVPHSISVSDASQLCAAKRTDCVLVVDDEEHLAGIFTAKDLAYRVVAAGTDPRSTPVSAIMTAAPMVTRDTTSATDALSTMVERGFRHLPVCNEDGDVVGLLDIAKVFYEALEKLERAHGSSQKLYNALEGVQSEWGGSAIGPQQAMIQYVESLRERMSMPDLASILDSRTIPCTVGVRTTVRDAARLMKEHRTTAVCVMESTNGSSNSECQQGFVSGKIAGIFTSKDIVLRVIAAGLDPRTCSVVRVMTPHPDTAPPTTSIQEALRKMHDGRYLNLPVVDVDSRLVGIVDVLKLTYATVEQINSINGDSDQSGGPMWNRFWNSFGAGSVGGDDNSALSSRVDAYDGTPQRSMDLSSEVHPNDSASAVGFENNSVVGASEDADDGTYLFKFVTPSGRVHRFQARYDSYATIREIVSVKLETDPFFTGTPQAIPPPRAVYDEDGRIPLHIFTPPMKSEPGALPDVEDYALAYTDDDNDLVNISSDNDVADAVSVARNQGRDRVLLVLQGGASWEEALARSGTDTNLTAVTAQNRRRQRELADLQTRPVADDEQRPRRAGDDDLVFGLFSKDLALPLAIGFLGVAVLVSVAITRVGGRP